MNETSLQIHSERHCYDGLSRPHPRDIVPRICNDREGVDRGPETFFPIWLAAESQPNSNLRTRTPEERGPSSTTTPNYPNNSSPTLVSCPTIDLYHRLRLVSVSCAAAPRLCSFNFAKQPRFRFSSRSTATHVVGDPPPLEEAVCNSTDNIDKGVGRTLVLVLHQLRTIRAPPKWTERFPTISTPSGGSYCNTLLLIRALL